MLFRFQRGYNEKPVVQAAGQTLPDATPPEGKNHAFSKIAVTFKPIQRFRCPSRVRISANKFKIVCFMTVSTIFNHFAMTAP